MQWAVREASLGGVLAQVRESLSNPCSRSGRKEVLQWMMSSLMQFPTGPPPPLTALLSLRVLPNLLSSEGLGRRVRAQRAVREARPGWALTKVGVS